MDMNLIEKINIQYANEKAELLEQLKSKEISMLQETAQILKKYENKEFYIKNDKEEKKIKSLKSFFDFLDTEAKKHGQIQRYKGLGEMNPEQLWETTMNPQKRQLLQVQIDDADLADDVFLTLMGDIVEPRRDFIEQNALQAKNVDA